MKARHTSLDKELNRSVLWLEDLPGVSKVVVGISECCRHKYAPGYLKIKMEVAGGLKINGYSGNGVTDLFARIVPIASRQEVRNKIECKFSACKTK